MRAVQWHNVILAGLVLLAGSCASESKATPGSAPEAMVQHPAADGKPRPPADVTLTGPTTAAANSEVKLVASVACRQACSHLTIAIRGVDGLTGEGTPVDHGEGAPGQPINHEATVRVPAGVVGLVVVDVGFEVPSMKDKHFSSSYSFPLSAAGAAPRPAPGGTRIEPDGKGGKVEVMEAQESKKP